MYSENPLVLAVLSILKNNKTTLGLYDLMQLLEQQGYTLVDEAETLTYELHMFRKNFVVMNALYQLQRDLRGSDYFLYISSLKIQLLEVTSSQNMSDVTALIDIEYDAVADQKVGDYYLDWSNFDEADQSTVEALLKDFWERYTEYQKNKNRMDKRLDALRILGLESSASWEDIQQSYRQKVAASHPDRGGSSHHFIEIREAYQALKFIFEKS